MRRLCPALLLATLAAAMPSVADAQLADLEQAFAILDKKLPTEVWDGETMNIRDYEHLMEVKTFVVEYDRVAAAARKAYDGLSSEEMTEERRERLNGYIDYSNAVVDAYNKKAEEIKPPWYFPFTGPEVSKDKPFVIDTVGQKWTRLWIRNFPGPRKGGKQQPTRYGIYAEFMIYYQNMAPEDVVLIQPTKGGKKLGPPKLCKTTVFSDIPVAAVECETHPGTPDYRDTYSAGGDIEVKLIYRQVIEGKELKNFESLLLRLVKLPQAGTYPPIWGVDYDMELGPTIIEQYSDTGVLRGWAGPIYEAWNNSVSHLPGPRLLIRTMFKSDGSGGPERVACMHQGKRIYSSNVQTRWDASFRALKGNDWDTSAWRQAVIYMSGVLSRPLENVPDVYVLSEHPGEYKCVITGGGAVLKELYFTVDEKGFIQKTPCQEQSMNAPRSITLIPANLKKPYNKKWDKKLVSKRAYGGGVTWAKGCPPTK